MIIASSSLDSSAESVLLQNISCLKAICRIRLKVENVVYYIFMAKNVCEGKTLNINGFLEKKISKMRKKQHRHWFYTRKICPEKWETASQASEQFNLKSELRTFKYFFNERDCGVNHHQEDTRSEAGV